MKKVNEKGFTLAELLIVVAIIAVLVAIAIPTFSDQIERSREAVDISNLRSAYSQALTKIMTVPVKTYPVVVEFKQQAEGWSTDTSDLPFELPSNFNFTESDGAQTLFFTKENADKDDVDVTVGTPPTGTPTYTIETAITLGTGLKVNSPIAEKEIKFSGFYNDDGDLDDPVSVVAVDFGTIKGLDYEETKDASEVVDGLKISGTPKTKTESAQTIKIYMLDKNNVLGYHEITNVEIGARNS